MVSTLAARREVASAQPEQRPDLGLEPPAVLLPPTPTPGYGQLEPTDMGLKAGWPLLNLPLETQSQGGAGFRGAARHPALGPDPASCPCQADVGEGWGTGPWCSGPLQGPPRPSDLRPPTRYLWSLSSVVGWGHGTLSRMPCPLWVV